MVLSWLSSKEQTLKVIGQTDITDEEQVKTHLNLLEVRMEKCSNSFVVDPFVQGTRS